MEEHITPARIANSISQDKSYSGYYILVEGKKDVKLYRRFIRDNNGKVKSTFGKYQLREVYRLLAERKFEKRLGIRDADFLRISGNPKYNPSFNDDIFPTDCHDSEVMMVKAGVLKDYLCLVSDEEKVRSFEDTIGISIFDLLFSRLYNLGCLRLANRRYTLGLSFKPNKPDGNRLKIDKFISEKTWEFLGDEKMINTVFEYSKNRGKDVAPRDAISEKLSSIISENHPATEIINGHDVSNLLLMISKSGLKSGNKLLQNADCVEDMFILAFDLSKFSKTSLCQTISEWQTRAQAQVFEFI